LGIVEFKFPELNRVLYKLGGENGQFFATEKTNG
jgi:hypothetical protein